MFIRFTVPSDAWRPERRSASGLIHAAYRLAWDDRFDVGERLWFEEEMQWFERFLPAAGIGRHRRAVCWFRPDAREAISRMWRVVDLVEGEGVPVLVYRTRRPGIVIYSDNFQIAAMPWRDTFTDFHPRPRRPFRAGGCSLPDVRGVGPQPAR